MATALPVLGLSYTPSPAPINGHAYHWAVEAQFVDQPYGFGIGPTITNPGPPSASNEFTTILLTPPNENVFSGPVNTTEPTLTWSSVAGASYYVVTPATRPQHPAPPPHAGRGHGAPSVSFTPSTPILTAAGGSFQWFVYAFDDAGDYTAIVGLAREFQHPPRARPS